MILIRGATAAEMTFSSSTASVNSFVVHIQESEIVSQEAQGRNQDTQSSGRPSLDLSTSMKRTWRSSEKQLLGASRNC